MNLYRVYFYVDHAIVGYVNVKADDRSDAWHRSWSTPEYEEAKTKGRVTFDATKIKCPVNVKCEVIDEY